MNRCFLMIVTALLTPFGPSAAWGAECNVNGMDGLATASATGAHNPNIVDQFGPFEIGLLEMVLIARGTDAGGGNGGDFVRPVGAGAPVCVNALPNDPPLPHNWVDPGASGNNTTTSHARD